MDLRPSHRFLSVSGLLLLTLIASIVIAQIGTVPATALRSVIDPPTDPLEEIRHEVDLNEYLLLVTDGDDLRQSADAALAGSNGGMQAMVDDANAIYGSAEFPTLSITAYRFRLYLDPNGLSLPNYGQITLAQFRSNSNLLVTRLQYTDADGYRLYVRFVDDNGAWRSTAATPVSDAEHYIEVLVEFASSALASDGRVTYWVDDVLADQRAGLDLYDTARRPNHARLGAVWVSRADTRGTFYLDEFVLRDDDQYIGPADPSTTPTPTVSSPTQTATATVPTATETPTLTATPGVTPPPTQTPTATPEPTNTLSPTPTPTDPAAPGSLEEIRHETDLSEYDSLATGDGDLYWSASAALAGTHGGMQLAIDDANALYGTAEFGALSGTAYRFRHYLDPNGLALPNYGQLTLAQFRSSTNLLMTRLQYTDAGGYRLYVRFVDDNRSWHSTTITPISDAEHYIEVLVEYASSASASDGRVTYWVDDVLAGQRAGLDLYDAARRPNHVRLGAAWISRAETRGAFYFDEFVLRDDEQYIGPAGPAPTPTPTTIPTNTATPAGPTPTAALTNTATPAGPTPTATPDNTPTLTAPTPTHTLTPTPTEPAAPGALVNLRHEVDLSEYNALVTGGGDLCQSASAALASSNGGLELTVDDANAIYGSAEFGALSSTAYRFRHHLDPNGLSLPNYGQITLAQLRSGTNLLVTRLQYTDADGYRLYVRFVDDNGAWRSMTATPIGDHEHYIEVLVEYASSASASDGRVTYWVDGVLADQRAGLDLYDDARRPNHVRLGAVWVSRADIRGTFFLDEFVLRGDDQYIGPAGPMPAYTPTATATHTATPDETATPTATPTKTATPAGTPTPVPTSAPDGVVIVYPETLRQTVHDVGAGNFNHQVSMVTGAVDAVGALNIATLDPRYVRVNMTVQHWEPVNDNSSPTSINWSAFRDSNYISGTFAFLKERAQHNATLVVTVWDLPDWMIENPDNIEYRRIKPGMNPEVAESIVAWLLWARNEHGLEIDYISLNEPNIGCFIDIEPDANAALMIEVGTRIQNAGLSTRILLADTSNIRDCKGYAEGVWANPAVRPFIGPVACHSYDQRYRSDQDLRDIGEWAQDRGRELWMTEAAWRGMIDPAVPPTWEHAINIAVAYSRLLKLSQTTTFFYWQMLDSLYSTNDGVHPYPVLDILEQFKHEIPPGARIVETSANVSPLYSVAAKTSSHLALYLINHQDAARTVTVRGLPAGTYRHVRSSQAGTLQTVQTFVVSGEPINVVLAANSVNVLSTQASLP